MTIAQLAIIILLGIIAWNVRQGVEIIGGQLDNISKALEKDGPGSS